MVSRSASRSDGEYPSSDNEPKATRPYLDSREPLVNRSSRREDRRRDRSRSRSPYRASRGEKRPRDDYSRDHDPRSFKVKYEDRGSDSKNHYHPTPKKPRTQSPARDRSRSPFRNRSSGTKPVGTSSVSSQEHDRGRVPIREAYAKSSKQTPASVDSSVAVPEVLASSLRNEINGRDTAEPSSVIVDEAAAIEARRKRREQIKNQYRGPASSLLLQALHTHPNTETGTATPASERSVSPVSAPISAPNTPGPLLLSAPQSPATVHFDRDEDLANDMFGSPRQADSPAAADYDPTVDMQNERARHDRRFFKEDDESLQQAEDHVRVNSSAVATAPALKTQGSRAGFDMFADDAGDEDDMFAPTTRKMPTAGQGQAQALEAGMMDNWDDHEGYYITILGELIDGRYKVTHNLGRGMFASVIRATDTRTDTVVAIKIVRNNESMKKAGTKEVDILKDLAANDPEDRKHVIRLLRSFEHKSHLCMVFENMSMNLREVLKKFGRDVGINIKAVRAYGQQLFSSLSLMRKCQYLHADLKPDNILVNEARNVIKLADLGSASPITENATAPYLVSRFYRAPEVMLGIEYDYGIDMWSAGCTLFELYTGKILFTGKNNNGMIRSIMECRGKFPHKVLRKGALTYEYFDDLLNFKAQEQDKLTGKVVTKLVDIKLKPVRDLKSRLIPREKRLNESDRKELEQFVDLLEKCLDLRPDKRITPIDALKHPFILRLKT